MEKKINGTLVLDGLIEGRVEEDNGIELIYQWVDFAKKCGLSFHPEISGMHFNILADNEPVVVSSLKSDPPVLIKKLLEELLKMFSGNTRGQVFSTIRSMEFKKDLEIQTLFGISGNGEVNIQSREVETKTTEPEQPLSKGEKLRLVLIGALVLVITLIVTGFFIDYKTLISDVANSLTPIEINKIEIRTDPYARYFTLAEKKASGGRLHITLQRSEAYPLSPGKLEQLYLEADTLQDKLVIEALARGYISYELFGDKAEFIGRGSLRIAELGEKETILLTLPYTNETKPTRIQFRY